MQGNWFHNNTPVIGLEQIQDYYLSSVAYGVTPLMNISPNTDGLIDEATVDRLTEFKMWVDQLNSNDLAKSEDVKVSASSYRGNAHEFSPQMINDGNSFEEIINFYQDDLNNYKDLRKKYLLY